MTRTLDRLTHLRDLQRTRHRPRTTVYVPARQLNAGDRFTFLGDPFTAVRVDFGQWVTVRAEFAESSVVVQYLHHELVEVHLPRSRPEATA